MNVDRDEDALEKLIELKEEMEKTHSRLMRIVEKKIAIFLNRRIQLKALEEENRARAEQGSMLVLLDIRGRTFEVRRADLLSKKDIFFTAMLGSLNWQSGADEAYFSDCDSEGFEQVLGLMRGESLALTDREGESVMEALKYFQLRHTIPNQVKTM